MIEALFIPLATKSKLWWKQGAAARKNRLRSRWTSHTTRENPRKHHAMAEGRTGRGCRAAQSQEAEWDGGCKSGRSLLKDPCLWADFHSNRLACSEHKYRFGCVQLAPRTYREILSEWGLTRDLLCTEVLVVFIIPCWAIPLSVHWTQHCHSPNVIILNNSCLLYTSDAADE